MCPSEPEPRYEVHSITGYRTGGNGDKQTTSFCVLDTLYCYREVATFYPNKGGGGGEAARLRRAEELCARLNAEEQADAA